MPKGSTAFFDFCRERETIRFKRQGNHPFPWTTDPVLQAFYFCNVFREDDKTTKWFRQHVRTPLSVDPKVVMATIVFRWFNFIHTANRIRHLLIGQGGYNRKAIEAQLRPLQEAGEKLFTGAYLIKSPHGTDKLTGLLDCMDAAVPVAKEMTNIARTQQLTLEEAHKLLMNVPFLGPFMAYEIVTDLRWTYLLCEAPDVNLWASPGPGCARGLGWVFCDDPELMPPYSSVKGRAAMLDHMRLLLELSRQHKHWPTEWKSWEMREVEHCLCEYDKYRRGLEGQKLKRRYRCSP
jgi:hypothetical protein